MRHLLCSLLIVLYGILAPALAAQDFRLITDEAGLSSPKDNNGVAVADYDLDGDLDIYLVAYRQYDPAVEKTWNRLYRNNGDGTFTDVTLEAGVPSLVAGFERGGMGNKFSASWGDFDNDGDPDLFLTHIGPEILYRNNSDGTFTDVTAEAGVAGADDTTHDTSALWWDYDLDGDLDIYVSAWAGENSERNSANRMYENQGDGTFVDVTAASGLGDQGRTWTSIPLDANNDGLLDLYVVNDFGPSKFYVNQGDKSFQEATAAFGLEDEGHGMGVTVGDYNGDGYFDIYVTNIDAYEYAEARMICGTPDHQERNCLFVNTGQGTFEEKAVELGVAHAGWAWGTEFFDCDHDEDLDLYVANGFIIADPTHNYFFTNTLTERGQLSFDDTSESSGTNGFREARGLVVFDHDNDGKLDLLVANWSDPPYLYHNQSRAQNWLKIALEGTLSNRNGLGAIVPVTAGGKTLHRHHDGVDFLGQSIQPLHFGVGEAQVVEQVLVRWPNGAEETLVNVPVNQTIKLKEGQGLATGTEDLPTFDDFALLGHYPNPFSRTTAIEFSLPKVGAVTLTVYNLLGREILSRRASYATPGRHRLTLDAEGHFASSGFYLYRLVYENTARSGKLLHIK